MKPETYKGSDAVRIECLRDYTVKAGSGGGDDVEYEAGKTYAVSPTTASHMLRKVYNKRDESGVYVGDAPFFVEAKAAPAKSKKSSGDDTVDGDK